LNQREDRREDEEILAKFTEELAQTQLDVHAILTMVTSSLSRHRSGTWVAIVLNNDPSTSQVRVADDSNQALADYINRYIASLDRPGRSPTTGLSRRVIDTGQPVLWPRVPMEKLLAHITPTGLAYRQQNPPPEDPQFVGTLMVPMRSGEATIGAIGVFDWGAVQGLNESDLKWLQSVADRVGLAIEHAQLHRAAIDRLERLAALRSIALAITSSNDLRLTLEVILEQVTTRLRVDAANVLLVDENDRELVAGASTGFHSSSIPHYRFPIDPELRDHALLRRVAIINDLDRIDNGQRRSLFAREGFQFYMGMSLIARNRLRGMIEVFHRSVLEPDHEWIGFFETVGTTAAIAVEQAAMQEVLERALPRSLRAGSPAPELSRLERWILALAVDGETNLEIAEKVHLSQNTIKFHIRRILQKAGTANRTELARKATQQGWL
jgi:GAF domain-containing protein